MKEKTEKKWIFSDLVDTVEVQKLMDLFYELNKSAAAIVDVDNTILVATGWQDICTKFHRVCPETRENCFESEHYISEHLTEGKYIEYKCKNGLWDFAYPIIIEGRHLATILLGQFFYEGEEIDRDFFIKQAEKHGFDKKRYLQALDRVPQLSRETVRKIMDWNVKLANILSKQGLANLKLSQAMDSLQTEITERKQAEENLRESEQTYRALVNLGAEVGEAIVMVQDTEQGEGIQIFVNDEWPHITGYSKKELLGMPFFDLVHPKDREVSIERHRRKTSGGSVPGLFEMSIIRKDGAEVPIELTSAYTTYHGKRANVAYIRDITERKQAEENLRESEQTYRALVNLGAEVGEAIVMFQDTEQEEGIQTFVNDEWPHITGYSKEELLGMPFFDLVHPKYRENSLGRHRRKISGESVPGLFEMSIIRKDGAEVSIELTSAYTMYQGKRANVAYIRDITERKKMEEQLIVTDRLASIGELSSGIAHELNNPLTGIIGFSDLLLDRDLPDDIKEDLEVINREAKRTAGVVRNLLTFARKHETEKRQVNINSIIEKVLEIRAYEQKVSNIEVNTQLAPDLPEITADGFQLQQVFINIVINAEHFMTEAHGRGTFSITTERVGDIIRASFADDGSGIAEENLSHMFDPFFTTKEVGKGTGLGLSICHGIITEHGGRIYAESELGKGATFVIELPVKNVDTGGTTNENS